MSNDTESLIETPTTFAAKLEKIRPLVALCIVRNCKWPVDPGQTMCVRCGEESDALDRHERTLAAHREAMRHRPSFRERMMVCLANLWHRCWGGMVLIVFVALTSFGCVAMASGVEIPDRIIAALVQVESGCEWRGIGDVRGKWSRGSDGEVSPFQLSPAALIDMGASDRTARIHRDPVLAESFARLWLSRCYERSGNWPEALSRYNAGSRYRSRTARDYSTRVLALAAEL